MSHSEIPKILYPLGWRAGRETELAIALNESALEMMAHRSDLSELAKDPRKDEPQRECYCWRALDLELIRNGHQQPGTITMLGTLEKGDLEGAVANLEVEEV